MLTGEELYNVTADDPALMVQWGRLSVGTHTKWERRALQINAALRRKQLSAPTPNAPQQVLGAVTGEQLYAANMESRYGTVWHCVYGLRSWDLLPGADHKQWNDMARIINSSAVSGAYQNGHITDNDFSPAKPKVIDYSAITKSMSGK